MALSERYGLRIDPDARIEDISVGMQQRVEILKMLYRDNDILIFDEPTAVLTPQEIEELMEIMRGFTREGKSILFITHKLNEIMAVADRCTVLRKGKCIGTVDIKDTSKEELSRMMVGREISFTIDKEEARPGRPVLEVENLSVPSRRNKEDAVKDVSFSVRAGEIVCVAGIEGNGQSELVYGLTGLMPISGGKISIDGNDITKIHQKRNPEDGADPRGQAQDRLVLDFTLGKTWCSRNILKPFAKNAFIQFGKVRDTPKVD